MTDLKKNIDHYMQLKGIKMYTHLLVDVARQLGYRRQDAYKFAEREKSNFSKMLKGERPLKYEYIIPLEAIFGVSLARMMNEDAYKLPVEKENVEFNKDFRYYANLDDPEMYKNEFDKLLTQDGKSILNNMDEFGKTFLDYVVEYGAVNGVRYLHDEYGIKLRWYHNQFDFKKEKGSIWVHFEKSIDFARLVASMNDVSLFYDIFDSYHMFYSNGHYGGTGSIYHQPDYLEILLDNKDLFNSLFEIKKYDYQLGNIGKRKIGKDVLTYYSPNPIINNCLHYALDHLDKYNNQAVEMLQFGIKHNKRLIEDYGTEVYGWGDLGVMTVPFDDIARELIVFVEKDDYKDEKINRLIAELPKFQMMR